MNKFKKSSTAVPLLLLGGGLMLTGCSGSDYDDGVRKPNRGETRYDYTSRSACQQDWGETACPEQVATGGNSGVGGTGLYHFYRYEQTARPKAQTRAIKVVRGGFGGSSKSVRS